jgi:hypothetical protein
VKSEVTQIGRNDVILGQSILFVFLLLWLLLVAIFFKFIPLEVSIGGLVFFGLIFLLIMGINQITISKNRIFIRRLFRTKEYNLNEFKEVQKAGLSPFVFRFILNKDQFLFRTANSSITKSAYDLEVSEKIVKEINDQIHSLIAPQD